MFVIPRLLPAAHWLGAATFGASDKRTPCYINRGQVANTDYKNIHNVHNSSFDHRDAQTLRMNTVLGFDPSQSNPSDAHSLRILIIDFRLRKIDVARFYTDAVALIFGRPKWGRLGCIYCGDMHRDKIILIKSMLHGTSDDYVGPPAGSAFHPHRLPFFQKFQLVNAIQGWNVEQFLHLFEACRFPLLGIPCQGVDGATLFENFQKANAEEFFTNPHPAGLGLSASQFFGRMTHEIQKNDLRTMAIRLCHQPRFKTPHKCLSLSRIPRVSIYLQRAILFFMC